MPVDLVIGNCTGFNVIVIYPIRIQLSAVIRVHVSHMFSCTRVTYGLDVFMSDFDTWPRRTRVLVVQVVL